MIFFVKIVEILLEYLPQFYLMHLSCFIESEQTSQITEFYYIYHAVTLPVRSQRLWSGSMQKILVLSRSQMINDLVNMICRKIIEFCIDTYYISNVPMKCENLTYIHSSAYLRFDR